MPDPIETLKATEELAKRVLQCYLIYRQTPVLCKLLEEAGSSAVMPLAAPIGTNKGLVTKRPA